MTSGAPDHTIKIYLEKALGYTDKLPIYEIAPVSGRYYATAPTLTDEDFAPALLDSSGRLIVKVHSITTWPSDYPDAAVATLLGGGLPVALDSGALKIKEQSPITDFPDSAVATLLGGGLPAALDSGALKTKEQSPITDFPDSAVATLLGGGLPAALDGTALKVKEQSPITGFATSANQSTIAGYLDGVEGLLGGGLPAALDGTNLKVKEQSPITDFPDSAVATLLGGGLPAALDGTDLKVKEQSPITDFPDSAVAALLGTIDTDTGVIAGDTTSLDGKFPASQQFPSVETTVPSGSYIGAMLYGLDYGANYTRFLDVSAANKLRVDIATVGTTNQTAADWTPLFQTVVKEATAPLIWNVTMTSADTEYSQALTADTKKFCIMTRDRSEFRFQYITNKVATPTAPWVTIVAGEVYYEDLIKDASLTLYFASASAGKIIEIIEWT